LVSDVLEYVNSYTNKVSPKAW